MAKISLKTLAPRLSATPSKAINIAEPVQPSHLLAYGEKWKKARDKFLAEHKYCVYCDDADDSHKLEFRSFLDSVHDLSKNDALKVNVACVAFDGHNVNE